MESATRASRGAVRMLCPHGPPSARRPPSPSYCKIKEGLGDRRETIAATASHLRACSLSESQPEKIFKMLAVDSAPPRSTNDIGLYTQYIGKEKRQDINDHFTGNNIKKLVSPTAQILRGRSLIEFLFLHLYYSFQILFSKINALPSGGKISLFLLSLSLPEF